jgi:hypothetical protein
VVIQPAQEPVAREDHGFPRGIVKTRLAVLRVVFCAKMPWAVQVNADESLQV